VAGGALWAALLLLAAMFAAPFVLAWFQPGGVRGYSGMAWLAVWLYGGVALVAVVLVSLVARVALADAVQARLAGLSVLAAITGGTLWLFYQIM
jgi:hypothetical protein